jgi:molybdate transport system substrate-binding protein
MQRLWLVLILTALINFSTAGCNRSQVEENNPKTELIIFAAASLTEVFTELAHQFEADNPGVTVILNFAGSQQLAHQLSQGAPADIFASANNRQMEAAIQTGRVRDGSDQIFARNKLVVVYPIDNPAGIHTLKDLARPGQRLIMAAPEVPVGQYAQSFFLAAAADPEFGPEFRDGILDNIVSYEENVRAVLSKVKLGEADAGIVYTSDVSGEVSTQLGTIEIPDHLNQVASYPIAPIQSSSQPELALSFIDLVLSNRGQGIISNFGFSPIIAEP